MLTRILAVVTCVVAATAQLEAGLAEPRQIIDGAFAIYKSEGPEAFVKKLLEGGPMGGNKDALAQSSMLRSVETYYGKLESFEVADTVELSSKTRTLYLVFNYENGPMFGAVSVFHGKNGWHTITFNFHTEAARVWPGNLLSGCSGSSESSSQRTAALDAPAARPQVR